MLSARRLSFIVRRNFLSSNRRNCRQEAGKGRIRRRAVFEKLGYGSTGALTLISAHLCPRLRVHVLRVSRPAKHRSRAQCTPEFHSLYTHARAQICLFHRYNRYIPQLRTLVVHRSCLLYLVVNSSSTIIFFFILSLSSSKHPLYTCFFEYRLEKTRGRIFPKKKKEKKKSTVASVIEIHTRRESLRSSFSTDMINGIGRKEERRRERIRIRKKFITRRNLVRANLFCFFFFYSYPSREASCRDT